VSTEYIWETFDGLFKTVYAQGRRVEELEARITDLEQRLSAAPLAQAARQTSQPLNSSVNEMPAERAA
jgi:phage shock protein A